ncbi:hypothetical protein PIGHUM_01667 [Pigmentiphaga humi]|uniref:Uncharacterized protein n=1 Tax=Pigmentiphaga humi TaxID=2478468 RepID=A0A3P4AZX6_9BURK|nr:hypothetical protein [Pigmentiphaga humi]VCU69604.1 hypothetical protein PIGHUM_01667 [Pigmentiphaga humi]
MSSSPVADNEPSVSSEVPDASPESRWERLKAYDANRPDLPGEHLVVFGAGVLLMVAGMRSRKAVWSTLLTAAGTALVGRAASGTGGIARVARVVKRLR